MVVVSVEGGKVVEVVDGEGNLRFGERVDPRGANLGANLTGDMTHVREAHEYSTLMNRFVAKD